MPITTQNFRLGVNLQTGDSLFQDSHVLAGLVIPKTATDNAVIPPAPNTMPSPWNHNLSGSYAINDFNLYNRWGIISGVKAIHNTITNRWEFGKHDSANPNLQTIKTTYNIECSAIEGRVETHGGPWSYNNPTNGCFVYYDSIFLPQQATYQRNMRLSEYSIFHAGWFAELLPTVSFWIYHYTSSSPPHQVPDPKDITDFVPTESITECLDPVYHLFRGMGFKFGDQWFLSPVFVPNARWRIEWSNNQWHGYIYNASGGLVYTVSASNVYVNTNTPFGIWFRRDGLWVSPPIQGVPWTSTGELTPWHSVWNIDSILSNPWVICDIRTGLNPSNKYQLEIDPHTSLQIPQVRVRSGTQWSAWQTMSLVSGKWRSVEYANINAIEWQAQADNQPIEMITGSYRIFEEDTPPAGTDLVVNANVSMPLVARCKNLATVLVTRVSGDGLARVVFTSPSGQDTAYQFAHTSLPQTINFVITEAGQWRVRVFDGDGTNLRFDGTYIVRRGDARDVEVDYKRYAFGLVACRPIRGVPEVVSAMEPDQFVIESGVDDQSWELRG